MPVAKIFFVLQQDRKTPRWKCSTPQNLGFLILVWRNSSFFDNYINWSLPLFSKLYINHWMIFWKRRNEDFYLLEYMTKLRLELKFFTFPLFLGVEFCSVAGCTQKVMCASKNLLGLWMCRSWFGDICSWDSH